MPDTHPISTEHRDRVPKHRPITQTGTVEGFFFCSTYEFICLSSFQPHEKNIGFKE
jgi:hypothetical protein